MNGLAMVLTTVLCIYGVGIIAYLVRMGWTLRQIEKDAAAGVYDRLRVQSLRRGIFIVNIAMTGVQVVMLAVIFLAQVPIAVWLAWGATMLISFMAIVRMDWVRQRLMPRQETGER